MKYYLSYSYLFIGQLEKGWSLYDYGFSGLLPTGSIRSPRKFNQPKWNGEDITGQKLLIWREQGLGDEILFSTCLFDVETLGLDVILECEPRLIEAYRRTFPNWQVRPELVGADKYSLKNDFDMQCPLGSLPGLFRNHIDNFNNRISLFSASPYLKEKFSELLKSYKNKILVGISWRGGLLTALRNDSYTSILDWEQILKLPNCKFVNLQYGDCENELLEAEKLLIFRFLDGPT